MANTVAKAVSKSVPSEQEYEIVSVGAVSPHPRNARQGDIGAIHESIIHNGFFGACVAQKSTGHILAGNHRYLAACESGMQSIPVIWVDVDNERALKILLADNRTNDLASYDNEALTTLLTEIAQSSDLTGTGFDGDDLDQLISDLTTPAFQPANEDEQGRLDQKKPHTCPKCGNEFTD